MQPVHTHILILLHNYAEYRKGELNVNRIFNELVDQKIIKRNKRLIIDAIHFLEKCNFIETVREGKQKEIKTLTQTGNDLAKLIIDLDQYKSSCSSLLEEVRNLRGTWDLNNTKIADLVSPYEVTNMTFIRYLSILYKIKNNVGAKYMLNEIIINKINDLLSTTINEPLDGQDSNSNLSLITKKIDDINSRISELHKSRVYSNSTAAKFRDYNAFGKLRAEVEKLLSSIIEVLELPNLPLNDIKEIIISLTNPLDYRNRNPFAISQFGQICQRYLLKKITKEYGLSNLDGYLGLRWTYIEQITIPLQVKQGMTVTVPVKIYGDVRQTSLKLLIVDPNNKKIWHPGTLKGSCYTVIVNMPSDCKVGRYRALILLYGHEFMGEDRRIRTSKEEMIIDFEEKIFEIVTNINEGRTLEM